MLAERTVNLFEFGIPFVCQGVTAETDSRIVQLDGFNILYCDSGLGDTIAQIREGKLDTPGTVLMSFSFVGDEVRASSCKTGEWRGRFMEAVRSYAQDQLGASVLTLTANLRDALDKPEPPAS